MNKLPVKLNLPDYHVHSLFSTDASMSMEEACESAIDKGITELAFCDHLDYDDPDVDNCYLIDFDVHDKKIVEIKDKYAGRLKVINGIEVGLQGHVLEMTKNTVEQHHFDFVIASLHLVDHKSLHYGDFYRNKTSGEAFSRYFAEYTKLLKGYKNYSVAGHLDLVRRYKSYYDEIPPFSSIVDALDILLHTIIGDGKGLEVNTSGYRYDISSALPGYDILCRYRELGGEIITIGSDAHSAKDIGDHFNDAIELIKAAGFRYISTFENMQPSFQKI